MRTRIFAAMAAGLLVTSMAACASTVAAGNNTGATAAGVKGKIAVLLPDSKSSPRWETADRVFFEQTFQKAGLTKDDYIISNAEGDPSVQRSQADQAITDGAKVLLLVNLDNGSGAAIIDAAKAQGVAVIDYDRLTVGGKADYYVSGDATAAGRLQGQGLVDDLKGVTKPRIAILNGAPTDSFATDLANGYRAVLDPLIASGDMKLVDSQAVKDWDGATALTIFEQILTASNNKVDGVIAANDTIANAVVSGLKASKLPMIPMSGLDGTIPALQHILAKEQSFTVYFSYGTQAQLAGNLAVQLLKGEKPTGTTVTVDNEGVKVPAMFIDPVIVRSDNIEKVVISDGLIAWKDICVGEYAQYCPAGAGK
jgi:D-xylose transport system substrate-binding protein